MGQNTDLGYGRFTSPYHLSRAPLVRLEGFEPPTPGSEDRCSIPLSYSRL